MKIRIFIGGNSERKNNIQTLEDMIKNNRHKNEKNMILKMDVEFAEWNALNDISENILLRKLYETHQPFYVHCCPYLETKIFGNK